ncbi:DMT family transporter [Gracilibacillus alcaliphilus]|uniref:DMT family transporter n=1 Tax=Gracilibacillus alcaliphilus TaxID=1401441 RepID=UPI0019577DF7|nr:multidrug efflux SMR transporter [Gracilibacillus alcaliphilus]MBM7676355.1 multidrug resistance protein EbrA [Gracilibacillus alcaliphilus]
MNGYLLLITAIVGEVFGSSMLKASNGFKKLLPTLAIIMGYGIAFYTLSLSLKIIPLGMAYAIWSGLGTALTALAGVILYKEGFNSKKFIGLSLIIGGVILLNLGGVH